MVVNIANNKSDILSVGSNMIEIRCNFNELLELDIDRWVPAVFAEEEGGN